jgi:hypothetical protein
MLPMNTEMAVQQRGRRDPGPPERGRGPLSRLRQDSRRRKSRAKRDGRAHCARVWFPRQNFDSRQVVYAARDTR